MADGSGPIEHKRHQDAAQSVYEALTYSDFAGLADDLRENLSLDERCKLLFTLIAGLNNYQAYECFAHFKSCAGIPADVPFETTAKDASEWAKLANRTELKCYSVQAFKRMDVRDQQAFLKHVGAAK